MIGLCDNYFSWRAGWKRIGNYYSSRSRTLWSERSERLFAGGVLGGGFRGRLRFFILGFFWGETVEINYFCGRKAISSSDILSFFWTDSCLRIGIRIGKSRMILFVEQWTNLAYFWEIVFFFAIF